ncbi:hypothetical protein EC9_31810 [Rosistilla ulvae]|uniref:Uncharacterized protein n=1 Tax=Rosistilla ulvae TaxID=1930277 RepID=A0A517M282_9BACT|nr:hypothetical protein [Rosistilla ulvae]QDS88985.1 hypothetical protein EC9_31810 [Rosistilla ulvae]
MKRYLTGIALAAWMISMVGCAPADQGADVSTDAPAATEAADGGNTTTAAETPVAAEEAPAAE